MGLRVYTIYFTDSLVFLIAAPTSFAAYFTAFSQDVTAYTASQNTSAGSSRYTHSGSVPQLGYVAVRKDFNNNPHVPFGSTVITPTAVNIDGSSYSSFTVQDTGIAATQTYYAIDVWWGFCRTNAYTSVGASALGCNTNDFKYTSALNFGEKSWNLQYFTPGSFAPLQDQLDGNNQLE
jgi:hypothetical protein